MKSDSKIITIGLCPAWDSTYTVEGLKWGDHKQAAATNSRPAGKALNISRALAWMNESNTAAGLWGLNDYEGLLEEMLVLEQFVTAKFTPVPGDTRRNFTVVDTAAKRELHLRSESELAGNHSLEKLASDLGKIVDSDSVCIFAGAMPKGGFLADTMSIMQSCCDRNARVVVDTSGDALEVMTDWGGMWLQKINVEELQSLLGQKVEDTTGALIKAARGLLRDGEIVLLSRGKKGAMVVTRDKAWQGKCVGRPQKVLSTVGCGDYLLAGFLKGLKETCNIASALETAIKVATAKAWGITEETSWERVNHLVKAEVKII